MRLSRAATKRVVDGATIILSVLLAFAIDASWDAIQERYREHAALESLHVDFLANRELVASVLSYHERASQSFSVFSRLTIDQISSLPPEKVEVILSYFANPLTFNAVRGSVDALFHSGSLGILRDQQLREALTEFVNVMDDTVEDVDYLSQSSVTVWNAFAKYGGPWRASIQLTVEECKPPTPNKYCYVNERLKVLPVASPDDLVQLRSDTTFMGHLQLDTMNAAYYSAELLAIGDKIDTVLSLIESNL